MQKRYRKDTSSMTNLKAEDVDKAWEILWRWRDQARVLKKDIKDLDHIIHVLNKLTGKSK